LQACVEKAEATPDNADLLSAIRQTRINRNHAIAEYNEIQAGLYKGTVAYAHEVERVLSDRSAVIRSKLLGLANLTARMLLMQSRADAVSILEKAITPIAKECRPSNADDFKAKEVQDRGDEPDDAEPDAEG
jgi:hypothetical protein